LPSPKVKTHFPAFAAGAAFAAALAGGALEGRFAAAFASGLRAAGTDFFVEGFDEVLDEG
jgi:hypothetical protein